MGGGGRKGGCLLAVTLLQLLISSRHWLPSDHNGKSFEHTLLGKLLSPSTMALSFLTPSVSDFLVKFMSLLASLVDVQEHFPADCLLTPTEIEATSSHLHWQLTTLMDQAEEVSHVHIHNH